MESFLRNWRQDAMNKHQYESAVYIGDKLLAITGSDTDAFWLAQVHFSTGNFTRAQGFLSKHDLLSRSPSCRYLSALCHIKQSKFEEALSVLGEKDPVHLIVVPNNSRRKLQHVNGSLRNGGSRHGKAAPKPNRIDRSEERDKESASDIKFEAAMCYLRGICYAKQNAFDRAKECYKAAVRIDVQCFEAFDQLMKNSLMSPDEEWQFLGSLDFDSISVAEDSSASQEAAQLAKMLYTTRLSKYKNPVEFNVATETLSTHYNLANNPDLLLSKAELLFTQCRFKEALAITESILENDRFNFGIYPLHLACLHELSQKNTLFLVSHRLADLHPDEPATWLAVGVYYLTTGKIAEARRFFSKASMMDPHFGPAWIGFAHTFAAEGEHDQAISAYSTAARLFQGTHLPQLFLGMQNLQLNNMTLAQEYLHAAHALCATDPLLLNELGVVFYHQDRLDHAVAVFADALALAKAVDADPRAWIATRANLGHAFRRLRVFDRALGEFDEVLRQGGRDAGIFCARGLVLLELGRTAESVVAFHEALAVNPQDPVATDLLAKALEEHARRGLGEGGGGGDGDGDGDGDGEAGAVQRQVEEEFEGVLRLRKREVLEEREREMGTGRRRRRRGAGEAGDGAGGGGGGGGRGLSMGTAAGEDDGSMMVVSDEDF